MNSIPPEKPASPVALKIAGGLFAVAVLWWFIYYAQYGGPFTYFGLKLSCINGATDECMFFQQRLAETTLVPAYRPYFWYGGMIAAVFGLIQRYIASERAQ